MDDYRLFAVDRADPDALAKLAELKTYIYYAVQHGDIEFSVQANRATINSRMRDKHPLLFLEAVYVTRMHWDEWLEFSNDPEAYEGDHMVIFREHGDLAMLISVCYELNILDNRPEHPAINLNLNFEAGAVEGRTRLNIVIP